MEQGNPEQRNIRVKLRSDESMMLRLGYAQNMLKSKADAFLFKTTLIKPFLPHAGQEITVGEFDTLADKAIIEGKKLVPGKNDAVKELLLKQQLLVALVITADVETATLALWK
ncbi:MAG: hypothetical protein WDN09_03050 [bacterium]